MTTITKDQKIKLGHEARGMIGHKKTTYAPGFRGIFQIRHTEKKRYVEHKNIYEFVITRTPAQQANRMKFRDAQLAWKNSTEATKNVYRILVKGKPLTPANLFIRRYMTTGDV